MAALHLKLIKPLKLHLPPPPPNLRCLSSSSSSSDDPPPMPPTDTDTSNFSSPPPSRDYASYFRDIKERLKSSPSPPRKIPENPPPPPSFTAGPTSLDDIRNKLASLRLNNNTPNRNSNNNSPSTPPPISFQELLTRNVLSKPGDDTNDTGRDRLSFDSIRKSLRQFPGAPSGPPRPTFSLRDFKESLHEKNAAPADSLPESIFGKELRERRGEDTEGDKRTLRTEFVKMYSHDELGQKLKQLRPEAAKKGQKEDWFSLHELNERLAKLREVEEREAERETVMRRFSFKDIREGLFKIKESEDNKKFNMMRWPLLSNLGGPTTPQFMLRPPQERLLENYFHPDHMSSAEKMKLELKRVRDEFKMSESDCGSARVQVAQLTTKIKHLSQVLHKKDKHSRKGLQEMVQQRKKLLKYLRRTDWESYCLVVSKLGLRDVPEYKTPDYKT